MSKQNDDMEELLAKEAAIYENQLRNNIIGGIAWSFIVITVGFFLLQFGVVNAYVWFFLGLFFVIMNIATLYRSLEYIDRYEHVAIGIVGAAVSGVFLLLLIAILVVLIVAATKSAQQEE